MAEAVPAKRVLGSLTRPVAGEVGDAYLGWGMRVAFREGSRRKRPERKSSTRH